jgi:hypothetical protein
MILGSPSVLMYLQQGSNLYTSVYETLVEEPDLSAFRKLVDLVPSMPAYLSDPEALITLFARA